MDKKYPELKIGKIESFSPTGRHNLVPEIQHLGFNPILVALNRKRFNMKLTKLNIDYKALENTIMDKKIR
ncbi:hypothetical protein LCGC14_0146310 [marine sediment metagenome]|uniref:Uncharacterized protein n=1 Tax=marine sediment metagenome TaxID=412755 RepID=A0A0F9UZX8_9ZZZZ